MGIMCVCVCKGEREKKKGNIHHSTHTYTPTPTHISFTQPCCEAYLNCNLPNEQNRLFAVGSKKKKSQKKKKMFTITPRCLHCWCKCEQCVFLSFREMNCINPFPTCFFDFPKHALCIIHTYRALSQSNKLS